MYRECFGEKDGAIYLDEGQIGPVAFDDSDTGLAAEEFCIFHMSNLPDAKHVIVRVLVHFTAMAPSAFAFTDAFVILCARSTSNAPRSSTQT